MHKLTSATARLSVAGIATILSLYVFFDRPDLILLTQIVLGVIMLVTIRSWRYVLWYIGAFILLPLILDIPGTHFGLWSFGTPDMLGFPYWLPFFYGNLVVSFLYVTRTYGR